MLYNFVDSNCDAAIILLYFLLQEICILYLATEYNGDEMSPINVIGMVVCLAGIALHVVLKAVASKGKIE